MEYHNIRHPTDDVNKRNTRIWVQINDNSKSAYFRQKFIEENGGFFLKEGKEYKWYSQAKKENGYWLQNIHDGQKVFFESMTEFGKKHGLTPVKICELLNGKRKTYKGWTAVELRPVKDNVGSNIDTKEREKEKVVSYNGATFQNIETKEVFYIDNISEFAKQNNINKSNLYKVARGKMKSYKGLKLFNPLEP